MNIIKLARVDLYKVDEQLKNSLNDIYWRIEGNHYEHLFAELEGERIISLGVSWRNANHPHANYIHFSSNASQALLSKLLITQAPHDRIVFSCWENEQQKIKLLQSFSFQLFRKTYMETYEISALLEKLNNVAASRALLPLKQLLNEPSLEESLFKLLKHNYEQTHLHNPVQIKDWSIWKEELLEDEPHLELSYIALEHNEAAAYIFVHPVNEQHYEIGWVGQKGNINLLPILKKQLIDLQNIGVTNVSFEVDTTDYNAWQFADLLDVQSTVSWDSYILKTDLLHWLC